MSGTQGGRYILCDWCCESTFSINLPWPHDGKTLQAAEDAGWQITRGKFGPHLCPSCVELTDGEGANRENQS